MNVLSGKTKKEGNSKTDRGNDPLTIALYMLVRRVWVEIYSGIGGFVNFPLDSLVSRELVHCYFLSGIDNG